MTKVTGKFKYKKLFARKKSLQGPGLKVLKDTLEKVNIFSIVDGWDGISPTSNQTGGRRRRSHDDIQFFIKSRATRILLQGVVLLQLEIPRRALRDVTPSKGVKNKCSLKRK